MAGMSSEGLATVTAEWMSRANCRGTDLNVFFIEPGHDPCDAIAVCSNCDVAKECLKYAVDNGIAHGIWGGKTPRQRRLVYSSSRRWVTA